MVFGALGFRVQGSGFRDQDSGFRVQGSGFLVWGFVFLGVECGVYLNFLQYGFLRLPVKTCLTKKVKGYLAHKNHPPRRTLE